MLSSDVEVQQSSTERRLKGLFHLTLRLKLSPKLQKWSLKLCWDEAADISCFCFFFFLCYFLVMGRWNSNQKGSAASVLFTTRLFSFMWTPSKAWILSRGTVHSLSPNNLLQNTSVSFLTALLFLWTAKAKSRGEAALPLKMTTVPLHFLPHHCVLYGLYRGNRCVAFDLASYSTRIWWWLLHDWNFNGKSLPSRLQRSQTAHTGDVVNPWVEAGKTKTLHSFKCYLYFLQGSLILFYIVQWSFTMMVQHGIHFHIERLFKK